MHVINFYTKLFFILAFLAFILRLYLAQFLTYTPDLNTFKYWSFYLADYDPKAFYANVWSDYLPGYLYILWGLGEIYNFLSSQIFIMDELFYKLPSILADIVNAYFIYLIANRFTTQKKALFVSAIFLFNPAILANSTFWGQAESFMTLFLLSSFYFLLKRNFWMAAILIGLGQTVKPVAIFALPIYFLYAAREVNFMKIISFLIVVFLTILIIFIPFASGQNIVEFTVERYLVTANQYPYTSLNAFNIWAIISPFWTSDSLTFLNISYHMWGLISFGVIYAILLLLLLHKKNNNPAVLSFALSICYLGIFLLLTRIHERHMFYGLSFATLLLPVVGGWTRLAIIFVNFIYIINLAFAFGQLNGKPPPFDYNYVFILSSINLIIFFYLIYSFIFKYVKSK